MGNLLLGNNPMLRDREARAHAVCMPTDNTEQQRPASITQIRTVVSAVLPDGRMVETIYQPDSQITQFAVWDGKQIGITSELILPGERLVPYSGDNPLLRHHVVLLPSEVTIVDDVDALKKAITEYVHKYVDLTAGIHGASGRVCAFHLGVRPLSELPYLRLHGEYGSGKTRFLQVIGSICRTPIFAGGASTVSPLFHLLDRFGGTLVLDEADFRFSDERAQLVKILNNGNVTGFPVLRSESVNGREYRPIPYQVFGPKIIRCHARRVRGSRP